MITYDDLYEALDLLGKARNNLNHEDYVNIWGDELGNHIWRQEKTDLLRIWRSGLTNQEACKFIKYIISKFGG